MSYDELAARVRQDPADADFTELRLAFTRTKTYAPYGTEALEEDEDLEVRADPATSVRGHGV